MAILYDMVGIMSITVKGADKVKARLERIKARMLVKGDTDILRLWGLSGDAYAKALCPVDTGNLRAHIRYKRVGEFMALVGVTGVDYAQYVEYGTSRYHSFEVVEGFAGYRPFLRPGCYMAYREVLQKIREYMKRR